MHTNTYELETVDDSQVHEYAILSHTWGDDEVTFEDWLASKSKPGHGYDKIVASCRLAREQNIDYVWIDTCYIDKRSSAELSETINSMFKWYQDARICYAFLSDLLHQVYADGQPTESDLRDCRWFTRGWTLQELLAPRQLVFFDESFDQVGDRATLANALSQVTGISEAYLQGTNQFRVACIAQRMSWVSRRQTKRGEDMAYCMLGIFDVRLPLLYGEGKRNAFIRLQEQIISQSDDESIFAWEEEPSMSISFNDMECTPRGILAEDPFEFRNCGAFEVDYTESRPPYSMNNKGLEISVPGTFKLRYAENTTLVLNCYSRQHNASVATSRIPWYRFEQHYLAAFEPFEYEKPRRWCCISLRRAYLPAEEKGWFRIEMCFSKPRRKLRSISSAIVSGYSQKLHIARSTPSIRALNRISSASTPLLHRFGTDFATFWVEACPFFYIFAIICAMNYTGGRDSDSKLAITCWALLSIGWYSCQMSLWFPMLVFISIPLRGTDEKWTDLYRMIWWPGTLLTCRLLIEYVYGSS